MNFCRKELIYVTILLLGSMSWGLTMAYWSPCKISMTYSLRFSDTVGTLFNFLAPFACIFGGPFINLFVGKLGKNKSVFITAVFMFISWLIMSFTQSDFFYLALITRFFLGFAVGSFSAIIPIYITELSPNDVIGAYGILHQFGITIGILICYLMGIWLKWRKITILSAIPTGLLSVLIWLVPESPVDIKQKEEEITVKESIFQKKYLNQILISLSLMFFHQFAGMNAFIANLTDIFNQSQINIDSSVASFIVGLIGSVAILISSFMIAFCGRKIAWHISSIGQVVALALFACNNKLNWSPVMPILCLIFDNFLFLIGLAPIPWLFLNGLFDESVKISATSLITAGNWFLGSVLFLLWDVFASSLGLAWSFAIFCVVMALSSVFGFLALPKIQGVEDDQGDLSGKSNPNSQQMNSKLLDQMLI